MRQDDPLSIEAMQGKYNNGIALVILGGPSGENWATLREKLNPDVVLTANGATQIPDVAYWMLTENMRYCHNGAKRGSKRLAGFLSVFDPDNTAETMLVSHRSWSLLQDYKIDTDRCVKIRRYGRPLNEIPEDFTLREYGDGYLAGGLTTDGWEKNVRVRKGTVGLQLLHHACILGVKEIHTIGFDLSSNRHWYKYPDYEAARFRTEDMFVEYKGVATQKWWLETADYLKGIEYIFERDNVTWIDHSNGLLKLKGLKCAA